ncbi:WAT1-related protein At1g25270-like [Rosa rugosa]|uniref:WAT1-related protein At1g25270-like n=1 Tax=Rosa rugosa TaxID=74645 RepID=UPI002B4049B4|nr:WAT1-related protein At1g25270-like [Rosa rugosa]
MVQNHEASSNLKPVMMMVVTQILYTVMNIMYKLVAVTGMNLNVFVAYRLMFSAAFMVPLALILERKRRPKLTWVVLFQAFLCGLIGAAATQNLYVVSLALTSPTFLAAISNLLPAITFVVALCFRQEKLTLGYSGIAKIVGTVVGIGGAMLFTFYRGPVFTIWSTHIDLLRQYHNTSSVSSSGHKNNPALGFLAGFGSILCFGIWLTVQAKMSKRYPCPYSSTALMCIMGSIQSVIFALCMERDWNQWKMGWDIRLWTAAYSGIMVSGVAVVLMSWCVQKRGALFVSIFAPLVLLMVALASSLLLEEKSSLGSVLGGVLIVCGLYMVLWGKSKEEPSSLVLPSSTIAPRNSKSIDSVPIPLNVG